MSSAKWRQFCLGLNVLTGIRCIVGPNLEILTSIKGDLSCGQTQNEVNFDFEANLTLKVKINHPPPPLPPPPPPPPPPQKKKKGS